jgi:hypothetical protein
MTTSPRGAAPLLLAAAATAVLGIGIATAAPAAAQSGDTTTTTTTGDTATSGGAVNATPIHPPDPVFNNRFLDPVTDRVTGLFPPGPPTHNATP